MIAVYTYGYLAKEGQTSSTISSLVEMNKGDRVFMKHKTNLALPLIGKLLVPEINFIGST
jgi:hypothetical protein